MDDVQAVAQRLTTLTLSSSDHAPTLIQPLMRDPSSQRGAEHTASCLNLPVPSAVSFRDILSRLHAPALSALIPSQHHPSSRALLLSNLAEVPFDPPLSLCSFRHSQHHTIPRSCLTTCRLSGSTVSVPQRIVTPTLSQSRSGGKERKHETSFQEDGFNASGVPSRQSSGDQGRGSAA